MATCSVQEWMDARGEENISPDDSKYHYSEREIIIAESLSNEIREGKTTISLLLQDLKIYIDNGDDLIGISTALKLLLAIFEQIQDISEQQLHFVIDYFAVRIRNEDNHPAYDAGLREIILLFKRISEMNAFNPSESSLIIKSIFALADEKHRFKDLSNAVRQEVYTVVSYFFRQNSHILLKDFGTDKLVAGLLELATFEKKASCLLIVFPLISHISQFWSLGDPQLESLFTSFIRYFPIKIGGLQSESLRLSLEMSNFLTECIVSNNFYASLAFPHFIQILQDHSSMSATTTHEIFIMINTCVKRYSREAVSAWSTNLWNLLKFEVWNSENEDYVEDCLLILQSITTSLEHEKFSHEETHGDTFAKFVTEISNECRDRMVDSPQKFLLSSGRIIHSVASSSKHAFDLVTTTILPSLLALSKDLKLGSERMMLLRVLHYLLRAFVELLDQKDMTSNQAMIETKGALAKFQEGLVEMLSNAVVEFKRITLETSPVEDFENDAKCFFPALESLALLFRIPCYLTRVEEGMIVQELIQILVKSPRNGIIHNEGLHALKKISIHRPTVFVDMILPSLLDELSGLIAFDSKKEFSEIQEINSILNDIADIACHPCLKELDTGFPKGATSSYWHRNFDCFVSHLLQKIDTFFLNKDDICYATATVVALLKGLNIFDGELNSTHIKSATPDPGTLPYEFFWSQILKKALTLNQNFRENSASNSKKQYLDIRQIPNGGDFLEDSFLHLVGNILLIISRSKLNTSDNNIVFKFYNQSLLLENIETKDFVEGLPMHQDVIEPDFMEIPRVSLVSIYPLVGVQPLADDDKYLTKTKIRLGINQNAGNLAKNTILRLLNLDERINSRTRITILYYLQILIAKFHCSRDELKDGGKLLDFIESLVRDSRHKSPQYIQQLYQIIAYMTTASFACYDLKMMRPVFRILCDGLYPEKHDSKTCTLVAQSFRLILAKSRILSEDNYVQVRSLRKGYLLELTKPLFTKYRLYSKLVTQNIGCQHKGKDSYLIALIGILRSMELPLLLNVISIEELVALTLDGTNVSNDDWAKAEYIKLLCVLIRQQPENTEKHIDIIIERMIERTHNTLERPSDANVECRILALEVLRLVIENFGLSLMPFRKVALMAELAVAKDDCHAGVRQAAAQCSLALIYVKV
ncbi:putative dna repair transcription protein [Golovinomyces cichoracearum]|uniref:MMS19 nucleotide excision repair protein n=1 Tax=Golovinomyces cichoracearum TaxID=62708 RepID=A0A420IHG9_9PEZI|nr:putative dna repair transcription protein [Golovinomyces cichoracearum]